MATAFLRLPIHSMPFISIQMRPEPMYGAGSNSHDIPAWWEPQMMTLTLGGGPVVSTDYGQTW